MILNRFVVFFWLSGFSIYGDHPYVIPYILDHIWTIRTEFQKSGQTSSKAMTWNTTIKQHGIKYQYLIMFLSNLNGKVKYSLNNLV